MSMLGTLPMSGRPHGLGTVFVDTMMGERRADEATGTMVISPPVLYKVPLHDVRLRGGRSRHMLTSHSPRSPQQHGLGTERWRPSSATFRQDPFFPNFVCHTIERLRQEWLDEQGRPVIVHTDQQSDGSGTTTFTRMTGIQHVVW